VALNRCVTLSAGTLRKHFADPPCKSAARHSRQEMVVIDHNAEKLLRAHEFFIPKRGCRGLGGRPAMQRQRLSLAKVWLDFRALRYPSPRRVVSSGCHGSDKEKQKGSETNPVDHAYLLQRPGKLPHPATSAPLPASKTHRNTSAIAPSPAAAAPSTLSLSWPVRNLRYSDTMLDTVGGEVVIGLLNRRS
jgi:hypothetical protein